MQEIQDMLNRMDYLATQSANGTYDNPVDRKNLQKEVEALQTEIDRIADSANFNGIKLLDGSLGEGTDLSVDGVKTTEAGIVEGIDIQKAGPGGSKGEYSFTIDKTFGNGDKFTVSFGTGDPTNKEVPAGLGGGAGAAVGSLDLTYDITEAASNSFGGLTTEEQAESIAKTLSQNADIAANFEVSVNGSTVTLKNINEGNKELTVTNVAASTAAGDIKKATLDNTASDTAAAADTASEFLIDDFFDAANGYELENGGKIELSFVDANGNTWKASVNIETDPNDPSDAGTQAKLMDALNATGDDAIYFENIDGTVADESRIAFSDLFTVSAEVNDGGTAGTDPEVALKLTGKAGTSIFAGEDVTIKVFDAKGQQVGNDATATDADGANGTAFVNKHLKLDTANGDADYSVGDKINLTGTLSDGRTFKVTLEAGKDFEIGDTHSDTNDNIVYALAGARGNGVEVQIMDDTDPTVVAETVNSKDIFNETGADAKEISIANNAGNIEFTSNVASTALNGKITAITVDPADNGAISGTKFTNGIQQTGAATTITVEDGKVAEGSVVEVAGQKFVLTENDAPAETDGNIYVKVADLTDGAGVAKALGDAITANAGTDPAYDVSVNGNQVTLTTKEVGSTAEPVDAEGLGGGTQTSLEFTLDPKTVIDGSRVTIEGREYEFVSKETRATKNDDGTNKYNVIVVDNLNTKSGDGAVTSKQLGDALKSAVEKNIVSEANPDGDKISIDVSEDGLVTIKGTDFQQGEDGRFVYNKPQDVTFYRKGGLTLQIGDTSDSYNQMSVVVGSMKTKAMGLDGISVANQADAQDAIQVIKDAINYVSGVRGDLGAIQNRLEHTGNNLSVMAENIQDAESTIRDTDVAEEMMSYVKNNILVQSAQAMLAQANQLPQGVLQLLG